MAKSEYIGLMKCGHCDNQNCTVHEHVSGPKKGVTYYRCYQEILGTKQRCGTVQITGPAGQIVINAFMRPTSDVVEQELMTLEELENKLIGRSEPIGQPEQVPESEPAHEIEPIGQIEAIEPAPEPLPEPIAQPEPAPTKKPLWGGMIRSLLVEE